MKAVSFNLFVGFIMLIFYSWHFYQNDFKSIGDMMNKILGSTWLQLSKLLEM